jgi:hypothetical protein
VVQARHASGLPILDDRRTTGDFLDYWVAEILPGTVSASMLQGNRYIVRRDLQPHLGDMVSAGYVNLVRRGGPARR